MKQSFKRLFWTLYFTPGRFLMPIGLVVYLCGLILSSPLLFLLGLAALLFCAFWQRTKWKRVGNNFAAMPSVPFFDGKPYLFFYQKAQKNAKDLSCKDLLRSLIDDKNNIPAQLPAGNYIAITHDNILSIMRESPYITLDAEPRLLYKVPLHSVLKAQTRGRCKRCKKRCPSWNAGPRPFYLVRFSVK